MKNRPSRRAEILDQELSRIQRGEATVEDCLRAHPELAAGLRAVLHTAEMAHAVMAPPAPSQAYRLASEARLRQRLQALGASQRRQIPVRHVRPRWGWANAAIAGLVAIALLALTWGVASASVEAVPGDTLYPIKRGLENARLALSWTSVGDASLLARFSDERLEEAQALMGTDRVGDLLVALEGYEETLSLLDVAVRRITLVPGTDQLRDLQGRISCHLQVLHDLQDQAPLAAQEPLSHAIERSRHSQDVIQLLQQGESPADLAPGQQREATEERGHRQGTGQGSATEEPLNRGRGPNPETNTPGEDPHD